MNKENMAPVVVVGAGPVGLTASLVLARAGVEVILLEAESELVEDLRTTIIQPSSLELWTVLGAAKDFVDYGTKCRTMQFRERTSGLVANLDYACISSDTSFPYILLCALPYVVPILHTELVSSGRASVLFGHRVEDVRLSEDEVRLSVSTPHGRTEFHAPFVIAADGTRSAVRDKFLINRQRIGPSMRLFRVTVEAPIEEYIPDIARYSYVMDPICYGLILQNPGFWRVPIGVAGNSPEIAELAPPGSDGQRLMRELMFPGKPIAITAARPLTMPNWIASDFGVERILFAGDSAHAINATAGMGMNSGVLDGVDAAFAVVEAVKLKVQGPRWLRYLRERPRVTRDVAVRSMNRYYLLTEANRERQAVRNRWLQMLERNETHRRTCLLEYSLLDRYCELRDDLCRL